MFNITIVVRVIVAFENNNNNKFEKKKEKTSKFLILCWKNSLA
jgi:hypothetical protein